MSNKEPGAKLRALRCDKCSRLYAPPKYICCEDSASEFSEVQLAGKGEVYSYTIIRMPFEEFLSEAPYAFAQVKLEEGLVVPGRFTNETEKEIKIGSKVSFVKWDRGVNWFELT